MDETRTGVKAPAHLWIIGILAVLWNGFGCFDYVMTKTRGAPYIESMMPGADANAIMAYVNSFPFWATAGWALGVWGGLIGSLMLLARHRWAVLALGLSLLGAVVGIGYQMLNPAPIAEMHSGANAFMPYVILAVAVGLFLYARAMQFRGVLR